MMNMVAKIFNGTKPADLPVEQPMKFEFITQSEDRQANRGDDPAVDADEGGSGESLR